ncbi:DUF5827 family protein [Haloparvum alkalitolerans]|uniref:DUF5827 family protein n=1 Tax=Haloparvum alkalitolerans TaxID=1042953 RepID=UPI003CF7CB59
MPRPKAEFAETYPCDFYTAAELLESEQMYTVPEIARLLQGLEPDAEIDEGTEAVLVDWAIPWVMTNAEDLVVAEPPEPDAPGYYGLAEHAADTADAEDATGSDDA